mmetsp:Transcript_8222/g.17850  ORF Transcript_8222/g.17850 Transcript_8222/m.17850 type:complete len:240 (-) Transcript_8222:97-816(-)
MLTEKVKLPSGDHCFWTPTSGLKEHDAEDQLVEILTDTFFLNPLYIALRPPLEGKQRREELSISVRNRLRSYKEHSFTLMYEHNSKSSGKKETSIIGHAFMIPNPLMQGLAQEKTNIAAGEVYDYRSFFISVFDKLRKEVTEKDPDLIDGYWSLSLMGVSVHLRSQGIGELMFKKLLISSDEDGRPVQIITQEPRIVIPMKREGFQVIDEREISVEHKNTTFRNWTLKRVSKMSAKSSE